MVKSFARTAVILDRHPLWLEAVARVLGTADVEIVGTAAAPVEALELVRSHKPDLLVAEICLGDGRSSDEGITAIRNARIEHADLRVVVLSSLDALPDVQASLTAGAAAYVLKTAHPDELASAIRQAFAQSVFLPSGRVAPEPLARTDDPRLTRRELEILQLVSEGRPNAELARMLWVTEQTIKFHLSNVYKKLGVSNRTEASRWAQRRGLGASDLRQNGGGRTQDGVEVHSPVEEKSRHRFTVKAAQPRLALA